MQWELDEVGRPFVEQLSAMGWRFVAGDLDLPAKTGRDSFAEVVQQDTLRRQLSNLEVMRVFDLISAPFQKHAPRDLSRPSQAH